MSGRAPFIPAWDPEAEPASYLISAKQVNDVRAYMADEINADDCAARLTEPVHGVSAEAMSDAVFAINTFINHSAVLNLSYQPELLSLVQAVQRLPALEVPEPKEDEDGGHISLGDEGQRLWADMPGLGHAWGDDLMAYQTSLYNSPENKVAAATWANAHAWSAHLVSLHDLRIASDFFIHSASYAIVHVLERDTHPLAAYELPAAAMIFKTGASELLRLCRAGCQPKPRCALYKDFDDVQGFQGSGRKSLWIGAEGYSNDRWSFWKNRWFELMEREETKDHAAAAVTAMIAAE